MAGDGSNVPDRARWPDGRLARIESGELDGMYMLVTPEAAGRWVIYVSEDPQTMRHESPTRRSGPSPMMKASKSHWLLTISPGSGVRMRP